MLIDALRPFDAGLVVIDQVVFDVPPSLDAIRAACGEQRALHEAPAHLVEGDPDRFRELLEAAFTGWIDFRAAFSPTKHALRADHDEYTTFFSESPGKIAEVRRLLEENECRVVDYTAECP